MGACPVIFRNSEIVLEIRGGHKKCSGCECPECREEMMIIDIHNPNNISIGCCCAVIKSKLITPIPYGVQG
jgi:hypothetical protein